MFHTISLQLYFLFLLKSSFLCFLQQTKKDFLPLVRAFSNNYYALLDRRNNFFRSEHPFLSLHKNNNKNIFVKIRNKYSSLIIDHSSLIIDMMEILPKAITNAIESLSDLPGIGSRSAERLVLNLMRANSGLDQKIARSLGELKSQVHECETCFHFCESNEKQCVLCRGQNRDPHVLCVVESPLDLIALEKTHEYKGLYHVLHGVISPLNRIGPQDLRLAQLFDRLKKNPDIQEIILATSGNTESDATAMYIAQEIQPFFIGKISRLSRGIPSGGDLDYLDIGTLSRAISERRDF